MAFKKGNIVHGMLISTTFPEIIIPCKMQVREVDHSDPYETFYFVDIMSFYDNAIFLKKYFIDCKFPIKITSTGKVETKHPPVKRDDITNKQQLEERIQERDFHPRVDSELVKGTRAEMEELYHKIQDYLISKYLIFWRDLSTRKLYDGRFACDGPDEWSARLKNGFKDLFDENSDEGGEYLIDLLRKTHKKKVDVKQPKAPKKKKKKRRKKGGRPKTIKSEEELQKHRAKRSKNERDNK